MEILRRKGMSSLYALFPSTLGPPPLPPQNCRNTVGAYTAPHPSLALPMQLSQPSCPCPAACSGSLHPMGPVWPREERETNFLPLAEPSSSQGVRGALLWRGMVPHTGFCLFRSMTWVRVTIVNTRQQPGHPSIDYQPHHGLGVAVRHQGNS